MSKTHRSESPDTASVGLGHDAKDHLGSLKPPIYETSTFVFETAEEGKRFFEIASGREEAVGDEDLGYIYSRWDNPNLRVVEARLAVWENTEDAVVFNSGMAGISTVFLTYLRPGDLVLYSSPLYGGTATLFEGLFTDLGVTALPFRAGVSATELE